MTLTHKRQCREGWVAVADSQVDLSDSERDLWLLDRVSAELDGLRDHTVRSLADLTTFDRARPL